MVTSLQLSHVRLGDCILPFGPKGCYFRAQYTLCTGKHALKYPANVQQLQIVTSIADSHPSSSQSINRAAFLTAIPVINRFQLRCDSCPSIYCQNTAIKSSFPRFLQDRLINYICRAVQHNKKILMCWCNIYSDKLLW